MLNKTSIILLCLLSSNLVKAQHTFEINTGIVITNWSYKQNGGGDDTEYKHGLGYSIDLKMNLWTITKLKIEFYPEIKYSNLRTNLFSPHFCCYDDRFTSSIPSEYYEDFDYDINYKVLDLGIGLYKLIELDEKNYLRGGFSIYKSSIISQQTEVYRYGIPHVKGRPINTVGYVFPKVFSMSFMKKISDSINIIVSYRYEWGRYIVFSYRDAQYNEKNQYLTFGINYTLNK